MFDFYRFVMDPERNPLRHLMPAQRFQLMTLLSMMWTTIFCAAAGVWYLYGELVVVHLLLALGVLITGITFRNARRSGTYRDHPVTDGTARYDDVWGA